MVNSKSTDKLLVIERIIANLSPEKMATATRLEIKWDTYDRDVVAPTVTIEFPPSSASGCCAGKAKKTIEKPIKTQIERMVDRFLSWKLPKDFGPDAGISFKPSSDYNYDKPGWWPVGTNLLTAEQAKEMFEYVTSEEISGE